MLVSTLTIVACTQCVSLAAREFSVAMLPYYRNGLGEGMGPAAFQGDKKRWKISPQFPSKMLHRWDNDSLDMVGSF